MEQRGYGRPDIDLCASRIPSRNFIRTELSSLRLLLWDTETVRDLLRIRVGPGFGLCAVTDRRLLIYRATWLRRSTVSIPWPSVSSVTSRRSPWVTTVTLTGSGTRTSVRVPDTVLGAHLADTAAARSTPGASPATTPAPATPAPPAVPAADQENLFAASPYGPHTLDGRL